MEDFFDILFSCMGLLILSLFIISIILMLRFSGERGIFLQDFIDKELFINEKPETPGSPSRRAHDMTKSTSLIGFESRISLHNGIEKTFKWYKKNVFDQNLENAIY